jgi:DNA-binding NtrC family response regulator
MAPFRNSEVIPLSEVPNAEFSDPTTKEEDRSLEKPVVLVVDDEPLVADTLAAILMRAGYTVAKSYCGLKALELAQTTRLSLLISDIAMPKMNGVDLALAVLESSPDCGVLLFSGHATAKDLAPARDAGYDFTLLMKPLHPEEMLKHVSNTLHIIQRKRTRGLFSMSAVPDALAESA